MFPRVTAILVVHHGGDRLARTLEAISAQRRAPDALVVVLSQPSDAETALIAESRATHVVSTSEHLAFGAAVAAGVRVLDAPSGPADALWLLTHDSAPEPEALAALGAVLETAPSVALVGPKLVDWERGEHIVSLGRSITGLGRTVELVDAELDQGQHDDRSDVLGVAPAGILVRREIWDQLGGFDHGLPVADDSLDFSVRARLAGHRVAIAPTARIAFAGDGVADPVAGTKGRVVRRRDRQRRTAELHRRLSWAPAWTVPLHWLALLPLAIVRSVWRLLAKSPGGIPGEFAAALRAMFSPVLVAAARRSIRRTRRVSWSAIAPLRVPGREMRRRRQLEREARRDRARGRAHEIHFLATGGGWVLLGSIVVAIALGARLLGAAGIAGGGLLPLSDSLAELWRNAAYGWRDIGTGFVGAPDPFAGILAVLGSLTFWAPSFSLLLLWLLAVPAAALGAWFAASRLTERGGLRAAAAIVWALAPPLLTALGDGRPGAVLAHVLLPWLVFAGAGAAVSWSAAAAASLIFAAVVAAAPSLAPALLIAWLVALIVAGRGAIRLIGLPVPALVLALPLIVAQLRAGNPWGLLADPGAPVVGAPVSPWQLVAGFPGGGWGGWQRTLEIAPMSGIAPGILVAVLLAPLAIAAFAAPLAPGIRLAALSLGGAALGFATAVAASLLFVATTGDADVPLWPGAGLSLGWLGLLLAAVIALRSLRRLRSLAITLVAAGSVAAVLPLAVGLATGTGSVGVAGQRALPAFVVAEAETDPRVTTLRLTPQPGGGLRAELERGAGTTLDDQSSYWQTAIELSDADERLAVVAGNLASRSGFDASEAVHEFGVRFVLLSASDDPATAAVADRAQLALDGNAALVPVGDTQFGKLWRFVEADAAATAVPEHAGGATAALITTVQLIVLGAALLLSIPTGAVAEPIERRPRRRRSAKEAAGETGTTGVPAVAESDAAETDAAETDAAEPPTEEPAAGTASEDDARPETDAADAVAEARATEDAEPAEGPETPPQPASDAPSPTEPGEQPKGDDRA